MTKYILPGFAAAVAASLGVYAVTMQPAPLSAAPVTPANNSATAAHPVVLELFQSQGCSSCPPANLVLNDIANRSDVLALNFAVTYWDQLGWKDSFAKPAFTARQWDYAHAQGRGNVQTPQLIINGRGAVLGSFKPEVEQGIATYNRGDTGPAISARGNDVVVATGAAAKPATVWLVTYDPRTVNVPVRAGENGGRTLPHRNIVKSLTAIGTWTGKAASFATPGVPGGLARAVLVQSMGGGAIVAAAKL